METEIFKKTLSQNFRRIRKNKGLSTSAVAEILGVSQAKISYIENCKGTLSATDIAILSRRLNIPVTEFFLELNDLDESGQKELIHHLVRFGAVLLAKPKGITVDAIPFEDVFVRALGFLEDPRLHQSFLAALITQASSQEIHTDRIFAQIGSSPFLVIKTHKEALLALRITDALSKSKKNAPTPRTRTQLGKISEIAAELLVSAGWQENQDFNADDDISELVKFVAECLHAKK